MASCGIERLTSCSCSDVDRALNHTWNPTGMNVADMVGAQWPLFGHWKIGGRKRSAVTKYRLPAEFISTLRWKRALDLFCVLTLLPMIVVVSLLVHIWITVVSPGPSIFRQTRIGRRGRAFTIYKFRTMRPKAETSVYEAYVTNLIRSGQPLVKMDGKDGRLIAGARFLRQSGLDELPQLLNVLRGEMSIVGPRPCMPCEYQFYVRRDFRRFLVPAGLTGTWQIRRNHLTTFREMMDMDLDYVDHLSIRQDLEIMLATPISLIAGIAGIPRDNHREVVHVPVALDSPGR